MFGLIFIIIAFFICFVLSFFLCKTGEDCKPLRFGVGWTIGIIIFAIFVAVLRQYSPTP